MTKHWVNLSAASALLWTFGAQAHDLGTGRFELSGMRSDVIEFVREGLTPAPHTLAEKSAEELELQAWVERFTHAPKNIPFFGELKFDVNVLEAVEPNANVMPDGVIRVNRGLIRMFAEDPQQLRATLAHELAHVSRAHSYRMAAAFYGEGPIDRSFNPLNCGTWDACKVAYRFLDSRRNSRAFEHEADQVALELLDNAGMDPAHLPLALQALSEYEQSMAGPAPRPIWREHPVMVPIRVGMQTISRACATHPAICDRVDNAFEEIGDHAYLHAFTEVEKPRGAVLEWLVGLAKRVR